MLNTAYARRGVVVAPHHLAAQAGLAVLREGGDAIEAAVATAATAAVVCPHRSGIGGDAFWLINEPGKPPLAIEAAGVAGREVTLDLYRNQRLSAIPGRGPLACNTTAGIVAGWSTALALSRGWGGRLPLGRLLAEAIQYARDGVPVSEGHAACLAKEGRELLVQPGFARVYLPGAQAPKPGTLMVQPALAKTLERIAAAGPDDFYRGELATLLGAELQAVGSPLTRDDLAGYWACLVEPLSVRLRDATVYGLPPPSQGLVSLMILGLFDRWEADEADSFPHLHGLLEATSRASRVRGGYLTDPFYMSVGGGDFLLPQVLDEIAAAIDPHHAGPSPSCDELGDGAWIGVVDAAGRSVSCAQSLCWDFGSGVVLERSGVLWHNRGVGFSLDPEAINALISGRKPRNALNPMLARFDDGRSMALGGLGAAGQPQTSAAVFSRYARFGHSLQAAISAPRWFFGRRWDQAHGARADSQVLAFESRFSSSTLDALAQAGHALEIVAPFSPLMGQAGAVVRAPNGIVEGASDPRSDGSVAMW